jgi:hypothetical protein
MKIKIYQFQKWEYTYLLSAPYWFFLDQSYFKDIAICQDHCSWSSSSLNVNVFNDYVLPSRFRRYIGSGYMTIPNLMQIKSHDTRMKMTNISPKLMFDVRLGTMKLSSNEKFLRAYLSSLSNFRWKAKRVSEKEIGPWGKYPQWNKLLVCYRQVAFRPLFWS